MGFFLWSLFWGRGSSRGGGGGGDFMTPPPPKGPPDPPPVGVKGVLTGTNVFNGVGGGWDLKPPPQNDPPSPLPPPPPHPPFVTFIYWNKMRFGNIGGGIFLGGGGAIIDPHPPSFHYPLLPPINPHSHFHSQPFYYDGGGAQNPPYGPPIETPSLQPPYAPPHWEPP